MAAADRLSPGMASAYAGVRDAVVAVKIAALSSSTRLFRAWILVPFGLMCILAVCLAIDVLFRHIGVSFPASVAGLLLLFVALLVSEATFGSHRTRKMVSVIDVPAGWSLRWISIFFTPSFVLLPLSPPIGIYEVLKIIAVFLIGFLVMMALVAYLTRGLQLLVGSSKRAQAQRAEELDRDENRTENIPLSEDVSALPSGTPGAVTPAAHHGQSRATSIAQGIAPTPLEAGTPVPSRPQTPPQLRLQAGGTDVVTAENLILTAATAAAATARQHQQDPVPPPRSERWAAILAANIDVVTFAVLFALVGLPFYYATGYAMPAHLCLSVLAYMAAMAVPASWRRFLHPVLVSSLLTVLAVWTLSTIKVAATKQHDGISVDDTLTPALQAYRTGAKYLRLWQPSPPNTDSGADSNRPGAGDIFASLLDASIVALALPMFQYRRELRTHAAALIVPCIVVAVASILIYPPLCFRLLGISPERSLAFAARSLTLALAIPAAENLGGDSNTVAAIAIASGILGVLCGPRLLAMLRIPEDDYVTRGVTLGINSSAIATALLLRTDPRAAALSSLSMSLFGTVTVLFTSIPPAANLVRSLVGL